MKRWKKTMTFLMLLLLGTVLLGCQEFAVDEEGSQGETEAEETYYELVVGHIHSKDHTWHKMAERFKEQLEENTDGKVLVTIRENSQLGSEVEMMQEAIAGTGVCDLVFTGEDMQAYAEEMGVLGMPYVINSEAHLNAVLEGEVGEEIKELMQEQGLRSLGEVVRGGLYLTSNKKLKNPEKLQDFVLRTSESTVTIAAFEALGAKPISMPFSEVYEALKNKTVEGQENTLANIYDERFYEVQDYVMETGHTRGWAYFAISEARFSSFPEEIQIAIEEAAAEAIAYEHELFLERETLLPQWLEEKGMEFVKVDQKAFQKIAEEKLIGTLSDAQKEWYQKILEADPAYVPPVEAEEEASTEGKTQ